MDFYELNNRLRARKKVVSPFFSLGSRFFAARWTRQLLNNKTKSVINFIFPPSSYITKNNKLLASPPTEGCLLLLDQLEIVFSFL